MKSSRRSLTVISIIVLQFSSILSSQAQTVLSNGEQPKLTVDNKGLIRVVFGDTNKIFFATSGDNGSSFSKPVMVAEVPKMHLGMTRGPQLATSKDFSVITAMDEDGNIQSFIQSHQSGKWQKLGQVNDKDGSAPEGLMSITADENNNFYAVWLDLRNERKNNICFATLKNNKWSVNKFAYTSPEEHVCECCKPTIVAKGKTVAIMFRNWLRGSRDLYVVTSNDGGNSFSDAQKLGDGTWLLNACPMDGGGLSIDTQNQIHTAWQRDGGVYYSQPGKPEVKLANGRHVSLAGNLITWEKDKKLFLKKINGGTKELEEGTAIEARELTDKSVVAVWEKNGQVIFKKL